jgi:putative hemolysin
MTALIVTELILLCALFLCSAFFSSAETALFSLNSLQIHRLRQTHGKRGDQVGRMLAMPTQLLSTILIGNTLVNVAAAGLGFVLADHFWPSLGEAVAIPAMTIFLLLFGEVTPKRLAVRSPERMAAWYAPILVFLIWVLTPLRNALEWVADHFRSEARVEKESLSEDEFMTVVEVGKEEGVLDEEERTMVDGIIRLEETQASDIMTPRVDLIGIDIEEPESEREKVARRVNFRYLPVYKGSFDEPVGFLDVPRFLLTELSFEKSMIAPFFVPETVPLDTLLSTFQQENRRIAFVADEYGGTAGLITRGDVLEEIIDDVDNEYGGEKVEFEKTGEATWMVDGNASLEDINYELDLDLEAEGADRIAGWVSAKAEHIPKSGEVIEAQGCRVTIHRRRKNRITLVKLEKLK